MLQKMCRKYLKRLLPAAKEVGLEEFVVTTIDKNKLGTCVATRQQVDMLASMCEDNRVKREEIPNIVGKSYRFCLTGNLFKRIRKFKDKGLYSKIDTLLLSEELKTNDMKILIDIPDCFLDGDDTMVNIESESFSYCRINYTYHGSQDSFDDEVKSKRLRELCNDVSDIFITMIKEKLI